MIKNLKMSAVVSLCVGIISFVCMAVLYLVLSARVSETVQEKSVENMMSVLNGQANLIENYVSSSENIIREYASAGEVIALLKAPADPQRVKECQEYTERFFSNLHLWEGIYTSDWDTCVLAHNSRNFVGMVTRKTGELTAYRKTMTDSPDGFFNGGAFVSPSSHKMIFNLRMAIYDDDGTPLGLVGGGPFLSGLNELLVRMNASDVKSERYAVIDSAHYIYAYNSDESLIMAPIEYDSHIAVMERVNAGENEGVLEDENDTIAYRFLSDYNLILTMSYDTDELMSSVYKTRQTFIFFAAVTEILIIVGTAAASLFITRPLNRVTRAVDSLGRLSLEEKTDIKRYSGAKSEVGRIADSVDSLNGVLKNIVNTLSDCSASLGRGSELMTGTVAALSESADTNRKTTEKISAGAVSANRSIHAVNDRIGTMTEIVRESRDATGQRVDEAASMIASIDEKFLSVKKSTEKTEKDIERSVGYLDSLGIISDNVQVIREIAGNTNFLAINASIEAARAGDAGTGFGVIASEIKELSSLSSNAADNISAICVKMNDNIGTIKKCFDEIVTFIKQDISVIFEDMRDTAEKLRASVDEVNGDMDRMSEIIECIHAETSTLGALVEENEKGAADIDEKTRRLYETVRQLDDYISRNKQTVRDIDRIVSSFVK